MVVDAACLDLHVLLDGRLRDAHLREVSGVVGGLACMGRTAFLTLDVFVGHRDVIVLNITRLSLMCWWLLIVFCRLLSSL
jgi:hypothetical protein